MVSFLKIFKFSIDSANQFFKSFIYVEFRKNPEIEPIRNTTEPRPAFEMGLDHQMEDLPLAREKLQEIVDRFDNIVVTERLFESLVLIAQRE